MTHRARVTIGTSLTVAVLVAAVVAIRGTEPGGGAPPGGSAAGGSGISFQFREGTYKTYRWSSSTRVSFGAQEGLPAHESSFEGLLNVRMLVGAERPTMAVQLSALRVTVMGQPNAGLEKAFANPLLLAIDEQGRFGEARFPPELTLQDRAVLDTAIRTMQVVLSSAGADRWETTEADHNGEYVASYRLGSPPGTVLKSRVRYTSLREPGVFTLRIVESGVRAQVDPGGLWVLRMEGAEKLQVEGEGGTVLNRVETRFGLEPSSETPRSELAFWDEGVLRTIRVARDAPSSGQAAWEKAELDRQRDQMIKAGVKLDGLMAGLATHRPEDATFAHTFALYLRLFPDEARRIPGMVSGLGEMAGALLFNILGLAGTPQAQEVLVGAAENGGLAAAGRFRALVAMGSLEHPTAETIERVGRMSRRVGVGGGSDELASTALLMLGALARNAPDRLGPEIVESLGQGLRAAPESDERVLYLRALENTHLAVPLKDCSPFLGSDEPGVRAAAASVVAQQPDPRATEALIGLLAHEKDPSVQSAVVAGLQSRPASARANVAVAQALASNEGSDPLARLTMVNYLGTQMGSYPANRQVLESALRRETNRDVTVAILNALATR
jgi:hypothetical protein